jgi:hypothetical protein
MTRLHNAINRLLLQRTELQPVIEIQLGEWKARISSVGVAAAPAAVCPVSARW